ncbi:MAG: XTP/dITP diphosphatase [Desulfovibrionales bacterium]
MVNQTSSLETVVLATSNQGKVREMAALFQKSHPDIKILCLRDFPEIQDIPETGDTFLENATIKAEHVSKTLGMVAIADDSGLEVDALNSAPGVYSARFSGPGATDASNNALLLEELRTVPWEQRTAKFCCVMVARAPGGQTLQARGEWEGLIGLEPRGQSGFGYDPLFFDPHAGKTAAQMNPEKKNQVSHRAEAMRNLLRKWPDFWMQVKRHSFD